MAKLFAGEDLDIEQTAPEQLIEAKIENSDIPDIVEFHEDAVQVAVEGVARACNELYILRDVKASLESKKLSSVEYFTSVENYSLYLKSVANNLGVKAKIPSLEDFKNQYSAETSHHIAMEGFVEFMRSIWEKIKGFFRDFFKRIMLFLKRLVNANLQMDEYEMYIESMIQKVKRSDKNTVTAIKIDSKLPTMLCATDSDLMKSDHLLTKGRQKLENLSFFINGFTMTLEKSFIPEFETALKNLKTILSANDLTADDIDNVRNDFVDCFKSMFAYKLSSFRDVPEEVQSDILNVFDSKQLQEANIYSAVSDRDSNSTMPNNINMYHVSTSFNVSETDRSSRIFICTNSFKNTIVENTIETISSRDNLLRFYDFYKTYSKEVKMDRVEKLITHFDKQIDTLIRSIHEPFKIAMESDDNMTPLERMLRTQGVRINVDEDEQPSNKPGHKHSDAIRSKIDDLHKFIISVLNVIQVLLRDIVSELIGTYQETRYELIKYIYKSAKQF